MRLLCLCLLSPLLAIIIFFFRGRHAFGDLGIKGHKEFKVHLDVFGDVNVKGELDVKGGLDVFGDMNVQGEADIEGDVDTLGDVNVKGHLGVQGDLTVYGDLNVAGDLDVDGQLCVWGDINMKGDVDVQEVPGAEAAAVAATKAISIQQAHEERASVWCSDMPTSQGLMMPTAKGLTCTVVYKLGHLIFKAQHTLTRYDVQYPWSRYSRRMWASASRR